LAWIFFQASALSLSLRRLIYFAQQQQCASIQLDSGVQRAAAHRLYFRQRLEITSYHFDLKL
jgi:hypothetical protein